MNQPGHLLSPERHIPFRRADLVNMCLQDTVLADAEQAKFRAFCRILQAVFHFEFHQQLETLKACYAPFNANADWREVHPYSDQETRELQQRFEAEFTKLLNAANYERLDQASIQGALEQESLFRIRLEVNFDDFEQVIVFRRGASRRRETLAGLLGLFKRDVTFVNFERVVIYVRFKDQRYFDEQGRKGLQFQPGSTIIKLFRDVPRADLEMLFPNTEVRMKTLDKLLIGVPAVVGGAVVVFTKLLTSLGLILLLLAFWLGLRDSGVELDQAALVAMLGGLAAVGGYLVRQNNKFKNRKIRFMKALTENLYFKNLDNDAGVFHRLLDVAEESESKEGILAYYFLLVSKVPMGEKELDETVETWFADRWNCTLDFEVSDALSKLRRLGLVEQQDGLLGCQPLDAALAKLDSTWDQYFRYQPAQR